VPYAGVQRIDITSAELQVTYSPPASTPTGVSATQDTSSNYNTVDVAWSGDGTATSYDVYRGGSSIGTVTASSYKIHTFTSSSNFQITSGTGNVEYLVVAGGGAGSGNAGGGGAGGLLTGTQSMTTGTYTATVGTGGNGGGWGSTYYSGNDSVFDTITADGGGKGGGGTSGSSGYNGGSGGGAAGGSVGTATTGQGNNGGTGQSGGGGGAGTVGGNQTGSHGSTSATGGNGGDGIANPITGSTQGVLSSGVYYLAGGGAGGAYGGNNCLGTAGTGGLGGGGNGTTQDCGSATDGVDGTGSGGGGSQGGSGHAGDGGNGVIIVKYDSSQITATGGTVTTISELPTTFADTSAPNSSNLSYTVDGTNSAGTSAQSTAGLVETFYTPNAPTNITDQGASIPLIIDWTASTVNDVTNDVTLTWDASQSSGIGVTGNTATNTNSGNGWNTYIRTAETINASSGGGEVSYKLAQGTTNSQESVGFGKDPLNANATSYNNIEYAMTLLNTTTVQIWESGAHQGNFTISSFNSGTSIFKVMMDSSGTVTFYHNGTLLRTSPNTASGDYYVHSAIYTAGSSVELLPYSVTTPSPSVTGYKIERDDGSGFNVIVADTGSYDKIHTFTNSSNFQITSGSGNVEYLVIAGGAGGGGSDDTPAGSGGGAGGMLDGTISNLGTGTYTVTVGTGGVGGVGNVRGTDGTDSTFNTITSTGGGGGSAFTQYSGNNGGSGGGGGWYSTAGSGVVGQGNNGGLWASSNANYQAGAGGGGSGSVGGGITTNTQDGANGGNGTASSISGLSITYAAGGAGGSGGGTSVVATGGTGGTGGGGNGGNTNITGTDGTNGTDGLGSGGGGGAGFYPYTAGQSTGGSGGNGIVIVRYDSSQITATGGTVTTVSASSPPVTYSDSSASGSVTYKISGINPVGTGAGGTHSAIGGTVPDAPSNLTTTQTVPFIHDLSWTVPGYNGGVPITNYNVYRDGSLLTTLGNVTSYQDNTMQHIAHTHTYEVSAVNAVGESPKSNTSTITSWDIPSATTGVTATARAGQQNDIDWTAPTNNGGSPITGYRIQSSTDNITFTDVVASTTTQPYTHTGLTLGTTYYYKVSAINAVGEGTFGAASATVGDVPDTPASLTVVPQAGMQMTITVTIPNDNGYAISSYTLHKSSDNFTTFTVVGPQASNTFVDYPLNIGTSYQYKALATNSLGDSALSAASATTVAGDVPSTPIAPSTVVALS
jgi:fibronectin type 3 domain-containing protein